MTYLLVKHVHVSCVVLSLAGFVTRGALMLVNSSMLQARFVRIAPHVVDTVLLASAIWLTLMIGQYPFVQGWLTAKVAGLVVYIALGSIALKPGRLRTTRIAAFAGALCAAAYVVSVALTKDPGGPLAFFIAG